MFTVIFRGAKNFVSWCFCSKLLIDISSKFLGQFGARIIYLVFLVPLTSKVRKQSQRLIHGKISKLEMSKGNHIFWGAEK